MKPSPHRTKLLSLIGKLPKARDRFRTRRHDLPLSSVRITSTDPACAGKSLIDAVDSAPPGSERNVMASIHVVDPDVIASNAYPYSTPSTNPTLLRLRNVRPPSVDRYCTRPWRITAGDCKSK